jgi:hypothetical protein
MKIIRVRIGQYGMTYATILRQNGAIGIIKIR